MAGEMHTDDPRIGPRQRRTAARSARGSRRREQIVEVASALFARSGFRGTGITQVADQVGITEPGLLYHFGSKEGLLQAVIQHRDELSQAFARDLASIGGLAAVREMPAFARRNREQPGLVKLFAVLLAENLESTDPAHDFFVARYRNLRTMVAEIIQIGQQRGEIRAEVDPHLKAVEIMATIDGITSQWLLDPEMVDLVTSIESYAQTLAGDLATNS